MPTTGLELTGLQFRQQATTELVQSIGTTTLLVSEIFGPTIQGEGPNAGRRAVFLRLGGCNLTCLGCDTPYTWRWSAELPHDNPTIYDPKAELKRLSFEAIARQIKEIIGDRPDTILVVTGGEPLLQAARLTNFLGYLVSSLPNDPKRLGLNKLKIEVETNGTREPTRGLLALVNQWNVSPKLSHWGNSSAKAYKPEILDVFLRQRAVFKFVCKGGGDVHEAARMAATIPIPASRVWIMPEGTTPLELIARSEAVRDTVLEYGFNFTSRLHVLLYGGDKRGV